jgi:hypothetical protein
LGLFVWNIRDIDRVSRHLRVLEAQINCSAGTVLLRWEHDTLLRWKATCHGRLWLQIVRCITCKNSN